MRAPFQILVLPFTREGGKLLFALFRRGDFSTETWQGIAGGGENDESPFDAARREAFEEAGIRPERQFRQLSSMATIPVSNISGFRWGPSVLVIPEWTFGVQVDRNEVVISDEHTEVRWLAYEQAHTLLRWDSNRCALWELNHRLTTEIYDDLSTQSSVR